MYDVQGLGGVEGEGTLYSEVQCIMDNGHIGTHRQTDTTENITFPKLRWPAVKKSIYAVASLRNVHGYPSLQFSRTIKTYNFN